MADNRSAFERMAFGKQLNQILNNARSEFSRGGVVGDLVRGGLNAASQDPFVQRLSPNTAKPYGNNQYTLSQGTDDYRDVGGANQQFLGTLLGDPLNLVPAIAPSMKLTGKATSALGREVARQIDTGTGVFGKGTIDPRMYMINTPKGRIPTNYNDTKKLSEMLERAATQKGYNVTVDSSRVSPSTYVTLSKQIDDAPEYQVRLSNHQDKYQSQSPVGLDQTRFSVDPSSMSHGTFEEAVMFLENKGFPTKLSTKYKNQKNKIIKQIPQEIVPTYKDINVMRSDSGKTFFVKGLLGEKISIDKNSIPLELRQSKDKTALNEFLRNKLFSQ